MPRRRGGAAASGGVDYSAVKDILVPYRRVSTREQADTGSGLAAQKTSIGLGLNLRGQVAYSWACVDKGKSGKSMDREGLDKALAVVRAGKAGGIIVSKLDRLSRSLVDFAMLMMTAEKEGWNIVALDLGLDLSTPAGKMMAGILAVFAQFERDVISQRTRDGLAEKRAEGVRLGRRRSIDDDVLATVLRMYLNTRNFSSVARFLNAAGTPTPHGGKQWYPATISKIVQSQDGRAMLTQWQDDQAMIAPFQDDRTMLEQRKNAA